MEVRLVGRAVAEERDRHPALALGRQRGAERGGDRSADDAVAADQPVLQVDHVHRAGTAAAHPGGAAQHLGRERRGIGPFGERMAVAPVGAGQVVVGRQRETCSNRDRLLPGAEMRGAVNLPGEEQAVHGGLEQPDQQHPAVRPEKVGPGFVRPHGLDVRHLV